MNRTLLILIIASIILILAFILFIFPGYYFPLESRKARSTPSFTTSLPPSPTILPSGSTMPPSPKPSGSGTSPSGTGGSVLPSGTGTASGSVSPSPSAESIVEKVFGSQQREEEIADISRNVAVPVMGISTIGVAAALALNPFLILLFNFPLRDFLYFFVTSFLELIGLRQRRRPWGTVYNAETKKAISGVVVKIIEADSQRVRETRITDNQGRFGFMAPKGEYQITAIKQNYIFPSKKIVLGDKGGDGYYSKVYLGGRFKIDEGFVGLNIPMDAIREKVSNSYLNLLRVVRFFERIRLALLIFGTILTIINLVIFHAIIDWIILGVYALFWLVEMLNLRNIKPYGEVKNIHNNPLDLAVVRFYDARNSRLASTTITDSRGRFYIILPQGEFYLTIIKSGYKFYRSKTQKITRRGLPPQFKIKLEKIKTS